jgi:hypothetical protein
MVGWLTRARICAERELDELFMLMFGFPLPVRRKWRASPGEDL